MRTILRAAAAGAILIALGSFVSPAAAHERRPVGQYVVVVGFETEPAYVEEINAALIQVFRSDGQPVENVDKTLKVEVSTGGASRTFDLKPRPRQPGTYVAEFIPTKTGIYVFRFFGTIDSQSVNERFESGPNRFDEVVRRDDLQFPVKVPSNGELEAQIQSARSSGGPPSETGASTLPQLDEALDRATEARTIAYAAGAAGVIVGLIGVALALSARTRREPDGAGVQDHRGEPV